jgi:hypothetical protein
MTGEGHAGFSDDTFLHGRRNHGVELSGEQRIECIVEQPHDIASVTQIEVTGNGRHGEWTMQYLEALEARAARGTSLQQITIDETEEFAVWQIGRSELRAELGSDTRRLARCEDDTRPRFSS